VTIERSPDEIAAFVRQVPNLPRWTGFFLSAGALDGEYHAMNTLLGPARTRIEEERRADDVHLQIVSLFGERRETASIEILDRRSSSEVRFHLRLPDGLPQERVDQQLVKLEQELRKLKELLEVSQASRGRNA
jgi:hypothetical protein